MEAQRRLPEREARGMCVDGVDTVTIGTYIPWHG
jgi:hypothetical protein